MKVVELLLSIFATVIIMWFVLSWADIILHNNPYGEHNYSPLNMIILTEELCENARK